MHTWIALLRAVNVGGTGKLAMADLRALCEACGFARVATYIQSGNVVFQSDLDEAGVQAKLEPALASKMGKPVAVLVRSAAEMAQIGEANPFPEAAPNQLLILFLQQAIAPAVLEQVVIPGNEQIAARGRELFIHFPDGMGRSKLKIPAQDQGTGRNLNTVRKLVEMARALA
jgi:uncharacterized protein (DUF1697 family)